MSYDTIGMFIGVFLGMGLYEICKAIAVKIRKKAFTNELDDLSKNNFLKKGFKIILEKGKDE